MKTILITNDDGFEASGLLALVSAAREFGRVVVVAPARQKSGTSHAITIASPLKLVKIDEDFYKLDDGLPADCICAGIDEVLGGQRPDLVLCGINYGANLAEDISFSGTCGGAMQGALYGVPSLAVSQVYEGDSIKKFGFNLAARITKEVIKRLFERGDILGDREFYNLNLPPVSERDFKGIKVAPCGRYDYETKTHRVLTPYEGELDGKYIWLGIRHKYPSNCGVSGVGDGEKTAKSDLDAIKMGYASLSPISLDFTAHKSLEKLAKWI